MREYYVYILHCSDGSYYTGVTNDLERRVLQHQEGIDPLCYTYTRRPIKLVYNESCRDINDAIAREKNQTLEQKEKGGTHRWKHSTA